MNKTDLFKKVIDDVGNLHRSLQAFYESIIADTDFEEIPDVEESAPAVTLEEVRAVLAEKSRMGMTSAVRNLLNEYGAEKLSTLDPKYYTEILKRAEDLNNGI